jgi:hypothetical protein
MLATLSSRSVMIYPLWIYAERYYMAKDIPKRSGTKDMPTAALGSTCLRELKQISRRKGLMAVSRFDKTGAPLHRYLEHQRSVGLRLLGGRDLAP